jgi:hypothetical protein
MLMTSCKSQTALIPNCRSSPMIFTTISMIWGHQPEKANFTWHWFWCTFTTGLSIISLTSLLWSMQLISWNHV